MRNALRQEPITAGGAPSRRTTSAPGPGPGILALQRAAGNQAVSRLLAPVQRCGDERHAGCPCVEEPLAGAEPAVGPVVARLAAGGGSLLPEVIQRQSRGGSGRHSGRRGGSGRGGGTGDGGRRPATPTLGSCTPAQHDHAPAASWSDLQRGFHARCSAAAGSVGRQAERAWNDILSGRVPRTPQLPDGRSSVDCVCAFGTPLEAATAAMARVVAAGPLAAQFFAHFLGASGTDLPIDVVDVLTRSAGARAKIRASIGRTGMSGVTRFEQSDYGNSDFQFAFGAIDCVRWRAVGGARRGWRSVPATQVEVSMLDYYEFHPERTGISQCAHAACVELVARGQARNFWMRGTGVVPWSLLSS